MSTSIESDTAAVFEQVVTEKGLDWLSAVGIEAVEAALDLQYKELEEKNMSFLSNLYNKSSHGSTMNTHINTNELEQVAIQRVINQSQELLEEVEIVRQWMGNCQTKLEKASLNMNHIESVNNQMETFSINNTALYEKLQLIIESVDIPKEHVLVLMDPLAEFIKLSQITKPTEQNILCDSIRSMQKAIEASKLYPANEMEAFIFRGKELHHLSEEFSEKIVSLFEGHLDNVIAKWYGDIKYTSGDKPLTFLHRDDRRSMSVLGRNSQASLSRFRQNSFQKETNIGSVRGRVISESNTVLENERTVADFSPKLDFQNHILHQHIQPFQEVVQCVLAINKNISCKLEDIYVKKMSLVYISHFRQFFLSLKDQLPRIKSGNICKISSFANWSLDGETPFLLSNTDFRIKPSILLQQGLDNVVLFCTKEEEFFQEFFLSSTSAHMTSSSELHLLNMMDKLFIKLMKRLTDFSEVIHGDVFEIFSMISALSIYLKKCDECDESAAQNRFLKKLLSEFNTVLIQNVNKYYNEQVNWLHSIRVDTKQAGVLSPLRKIMTFFNRLEENAIGSTDLNDQGSHFLTSYSTFINNVVGWLEKMANSKAKYADVVRLENYYYLSKGAEILAKRNSNSALDHFSKQAYASYLTSQTLYVTWLCEFEFQKLSVFFKTVEKLLQTLPSGEVQFHIPKSEVRRVINNISVEKGIRHAVERMQKHLSRELNLLPTIWKLFQAHALDIYIKYEKLAWDCYQLQLNPTSSKLREFTTEYQF